jgi:hypothetical protein
MDRDMTIKNWVPCICLVPYSSNKYEVIHKIGKRVFVDLSGNINIQTCGICKGKGYLTQDDLDETIKQYKKIWRSELILIKKSKKLIKLYKKYPELRKFKWVLS